MVEVTPERKTGYEDKTLKTVILNWLWHPTPADRIAAGSELRKRMIKHHPRPEWLPERTTNGNMANKSE